MFKLLGYCIFMIVACFIENMLAYSLIRIIDKKERVKINDSEMEHAEDLKKELGVK